MIESLVSVVGQRGVDAAAFLLAFALTALPGWGTERGTALKP